MVKKGYVIKGVVLRRPLPSSSLKLHGRKTRGMGMCPDLASRGFCQLHKPME